MVNKEKIIKLLSDNKIIKKKNARLKYEFPFGFAIPSTNSGCSILCRIVLGAIIKSLDYSGSLIGISISSTKPFETNNKVNKRRKVGIGLPPPIKEMKNNDGEIIRLVQVNCSLSTPIEYSLFRQYLNDSLQFSISNWCNEFENIYNEIHNNKIIPKLMICTASPNDDICNQWIEFIQSIIPPLFDNDESKFILHHMDEKHATICIMDQLIRSYNEEEEDESDNESDNESDEDEKTKDQDKQVLVQELNIGHYVQSIMDHTANIFNFIHGKTSSIYKNVNADSTIIIDCDYNNNVGKILQFMKNKYLDPNPQTPCIELYYTNLDDDTNDSNDSNGKHGARYVQFSGLPASEFITNGNIAIYNNAYFVSIDSNQQNIVHYVLTKNNKAYVINNEKLGVLIWYFLRCLANHTSISNTIHIFLSVGRDSSSDYLDFLDITKIEIYSHDKKSYNDIMNEYCDECVICIEYKQCGSSIIVFSNIIVEKLQYISDKNDTFTPEDALLDFYRLFESGNNDSIINFLIAQLSLQLFHIGISEWIDIYDIDLLSLYQHSITVAANKAKNNQQQQQQPQPQPHQQYKQQSDEQNEESSEFVDTDTDTTTSQEQEEDDDDDEYDDEYDDDDDDLAAENEPIETEEKQIQQNDSKDEEINDELNEEINEEINEETNKETNAEINEEIKEETNEEINKETNAEINEEIKEINETNEIKEETTKDEETHASDSKSETKYKLLIAAPLNQSKSTDAEQYIGHKHGHIGNETSVDIDSYANAMSEADRTQILNDKKKKHAKRTESVTLKKLQQDLLENETTANTNTNTTTVVNIKLSLRERALFSYQNSIKNQKRWKMEDAWLNKQRAKQSRGIPLKSQKSSSLLQRMEQLNKNQKKYDDEQEWRAKLKERNNKNVYNNINNNNKGDVEQIKNINTNIDKESIIDDTHRDRKARDSPIALSPTVSGHKRHTSASQQAIIKRLTASANEWKKKYKKTEPDQTLQNLKKKTSKQKKKTSKSEKKMHLKNVGNKNKRNKKNKTAKWKSEKSMSESKENINDLIYRHICEMNDANDINDINSTIANENNDLILLGLQVTKINNNNNTSNDKLNKIELIFEERLNNYQIELLNIQNRFEKEISYSKNENDQTDEKDFYSQNQENTNSNNNNMNEAIIDANMKINHQNCFKILKDLNILTNDNTVLNMNNCFILNQLNESKQIIFKNIIKYCIINNTRLISIQCTNTNGLNDEWFTHDILFPISCNCKILTELLFNNNELLTSKSIKELIKYIVSNPPCLRILKFKNLSENINMTNEILNALHKNTQIIKVVMDTQTTEQNDKLQSILDRNWKRHAKEKRLKKTLLTQIQNRKNKLKNNKKNKKKLEKRKNPIKK